MLYLTLATIQQLVTDEVVEQTFASRGDPIIDRTDDFHREMAILKFPYNLPCVRRSSVDETRDESPA
jgi:hypothetical protein